MKISKPEATAIPSDLGSRSSILPANRHLRRDGVPPQRDGEMRIELSSVSLHSIYYSSMSQAALYHGPFISTKGIIHRSAL